MASSPFTPSSDCFSPVLRDTLDTGSSHLQPSHEYPLPSSSSTSSSSSSPNPSPTSTSTSNPNPTLKPTHLLHPLLSSIPPAYHSLLSGAGAGLISATLTCPLDVLKTRLQAQSLSRSDVGYQGVGDTIKKIWGQSGGKGFYRGLGPTIMGYLPTWGIYFSVYDEVKGRLASEDGESSGREWTVHILAAMTAGATGTIVTNPLWVIKTRFMAQAIIDPSQPRYRNTLEAARTIYRNEGIRAFYKGLAPSLLGVSHVAVQFPLYEQLKVWATPPDGSPIQSKTILLCSATSKMCASLVTYPHEVLRTRLQIQRNTQKKALVESVGSQSASSSTTTTTSTTSSPAPSSSSTIPTKPTPPEIINLKSHGPKTRLSPSNLPTGSSTMNQVTPTLKTTKGLISTAQTIWQNDGWKGFYRGITVNLVRTIPAAAMTMLTYELIMRSFAEV